MLAQQVSGVHSGNVVRQLVHRTGFGVFIFFLTHVPLAILMSTYQTIATAHALVVFTVGVWWAVGRKTLERVLYVSAYIAGAEVLWRMTGAQVFWEFGKYAVAGIGLIALFRTGKIGRFHIALVYFVLLLPSIGYTLGELSLNSARQQLSFNLSGPLAVTVAVWLFSQVSLTWEEVQRAFIALIGPVIGISTLALVSTVTASSINFTGESNFVTSGGFGPNQVSSMLGIAALVAYLCVVSGNFGNGLKGFLLFLVVVFSAQSALTLSRGGLVTALVAGALTAFFLLRDTKSRIRFVLVVTLLGSLAFREVIPRLDEFTEGVFLERFQDFDLGNRDTLIDADLQIWKENPLTGVGPGMSMYHREGLLKGVSAHTEFTRLLAEHGLLGLLGLLILTFFSIDLVRKSRTARIRAATVALITWAVVFMLHSAMRVVAPAVALGLAAALVVRENHGNEQP